MAAAVSSLTLRSAPACRKRCRRIASSSSIASHAPLAIPSASGVEEPGTDWCRVSIPL
jgi:hypothetical protein